MLIADVEGEEWWIHAFPKVTNGKWNAALARIWTRLTGSIFLDNNVTYTRFFLFV